MPHIDYLYNSFGEWIAFRQGRNVYSPAGLWIGWLPWNDAEVVDIDGRYLGTIHEGNRLFHELTHPGREHPDHPGYPGYPGSPGFPGFPGYANLPPDTVDVTIA